MSGRSRVWGRDGFRPPGLCGPYRLVGESSIASSTRVESVQNLIEDQHQHAAAEFVPAEADALQEVIVVLVVAGESGGANPGGDDASSLAEQQAQQQRGEPPAGAAVESGGDPIGPVFPIVGRVIRCHPWLSGSHQMRLTTSVWPKGRVCLKTDLTASRYCFVRKCSYCNRGTQKRRWATEIAA